ncbi:MAG: endonuclease [Rhodothermales bacterium]
MRSPSLLLLILLASPTAAQPCEGRGWTLRACLRATYKPADLALDYDAQRDRLFADVWLETDTAGVARIEGAYGGMTVVIDPDSAASPREQAQSRSFNTEHVYPQSRGASSGNARADLHHLMPVQEAINSARSNFPFDEVGDEAVLWCRVGGCTATRPTTSGDGSWSRIYREGTGPFYHDGRFEPRDAVKGDVARAAFYFATMYQVEAEDSMTWPEGRRWFLDQRDVLLDWHEADPPDAAETARTWRAAAYQGDRPNPYVLFPQLVRDAFFRGQQQQGGEPEVWINELHATNDGPDTGEGVELAGRAGTDLYAWRLVFYGGHDGEPYNPIDSLVAERVTFDLPIPDEVGRLGAVWQPVRGMWNRCNGLALFDPDLELVQFLSYGGCSFNVVSGPVYDHALSNGASGDPSDGPDADTPDSLLWSTPLLGLGGHGRPQEWATLPPGYSLQLTGAGDTYEDFTWGGPYPATPGRLGDYQAPSDGNRTSGWKPGDAIPVIADELTPPLAEIADAYRATLLLSPSMRGSTAKGLVPEPGGGPDHALTVGSPHPNPARSLTRIDVAVAPDALGDAPVSAEVYDVLGRHVTTSTVRGTPSGSAIDLNVAAFAPGLYVVRVTTTRPDGRTETAARRFTVVR